MKREIKFRGYSHRHKEWGYGSVDLSYIDNVYISTKDYIMEVDRETIGQYIGIKDNNGVEIYEGDICRCITCFETGDYKTRTYFNAQVVWDEEEFRFGLENEEGMWYLDNSDNLKDNLEVIGNIYDNPELLSNCSEIPNTSLIK